MYEDILYSVNGPVAEIRFNRPDRLNAMTPRMRVEFKHAVAQAEADENVVGIVITGEGRGFCAGADMQGLSELGKSGGTGARKVEDYGLDADPGDPDVGEDFKLTYTYLMTVRKPVIAAINGPCAGLGFVFAMLCDIRFIAEEAVITASFSQRGLVAEYGVSWILPRIIGVSKALDFLWTSRKVRGPEAVELGLADRLFPADQVVAEARAYVENLAENCAPYSLMMMKRQVYRQLTQPIGDALNETIGWVNESTTRDDFREGVQAYVEKRPPNFGRVKAS